MPDTVLNIINELSQGIGLLSIALTGKEIEVLGSERTCSSSPSWGVWQWGREGGGGVWVANHSPHCLPKAGGNQPRAGSASWEGQMTGPRLKAQGQEPGMGKSHCAGGSRSLGEGEGMDMHLPKQQMSRKGAGKG